MQQPESGRNNRSGAHAESTMQSDGPEFEAGEPDRDEGSTAPGTESGAVPAIDLAAELEACRARETQHYDAFLRAKAEMENVRRRGLDDVAKARKFGIESFADSLLGVADSLEAALADQQADSATLRQGVELTLRQLFAAFEKNQLVALDPKGEKFDPHRHQAISTQPADGVASNHVVAVLQKGWMISDRVLRPALVTVAP